MANLSGLEGIVNDEVETVEILYVSSRKRQFILLSNGCDLCVEWADLSTLSASGRAYLPIDLSRRCTEEQDSRIECLVQKNPKGLAQSTLTLTFRQTLDTKMYFSNRD